MAVGLVAVVALPVQAQTEPEYPSPEWTAREAENYSTTGQAPTQQQSDPAFQQRWRTQSAENFAEYTQRSIDDPNWRSDGNLCATWSEQCTGDPYRYPGVDPFYDDEGKVEPVAFLDTGLESDAGGARLSGRVWAPINATAGARLPGVVIINGSVQAPETLYWWAAQALVRSGYVVMTFDPRGQGRSDTQTPDGTQGSNANPNVFVTDLVDAVDFFLSTPDAPYAGNAANPDLATTAHNPFWDLIDPERLGIVGHSLGAAGVSVVQGIEPWPGSSVTDNPVDVAVAWDNLNPSGNALAGFDVIPRVPAMGQSADYYLTPQPKESPPDPDEKRQGYLAWVEAGLPTYQLVIRGGTHYEWSLIPTFPASAWEPGGDSGWGRPLGEHYTVAWLDRWLKEPGESGYDTADARLLADDMEHDGATWRERLSFYYLSSRSFQDRGGTAHVCEDILRGCTDASSAPDEPAPDSAPETAPDTTSGDASSLPTTGGGLGALALLAAAAATRLRR